MNFWNAIAIGLKEVWAHKFRSLLTMMGIILGVASLVAMAAMVKGMENGLKEALIQIGGIQKIRIEEGDIPPPAVASGRSGGGEHDERCAGAAKICHARGTGHAGNAGPQHHHPGPQEFLSLDVCGHVAYCVGNE
jgi:ABC-type lipoprotein release transport system permease subunit